MEAAATQLDGIWQEEPEGSFGAKRKKTQGATCKACNNEKALGVTPAQESKAASTDDEAGAMGGAKVPCEILWGSHSFYVPTTSSGSGCCDVTKGSVVHAMGVPFGQKCDN
jgi:hypothetical protein